MAWRTVQSKTGPRRYYYATERVRGAVRTFYFGFGPDAEEAAQKQKLRHEIRRARQRAIAEIVALRKLGADTFHEIDLLLRAALVATGFYKHARGEWRKRRYTMPTDHPFQGSPPPAPRPSKSWSSRQILAIRVPSTACGSTFIRTPRLGKGLGMWQLMHWSLAFNKLPTGIAWSPSRFGCRLSPCGQD